MNKIVLPIILSLFLFSCNKDNINEDIDINKEIREEVNLQSEKDKEAVLVNKIDLVLDYVCDEITDDILDFNYTSFHIKELDMDTFEVARIKNVEKSDICPEMLNEKAKKYYSEFDNSIVLINENFIVLDGEAFPKSDLEHISSFSFSKLINIESLNKNYKIYHFTVRFITGYRIELNFSSDKLASEAKNKLLSANYDFSNRTIVVVK